MAKKADRKRLYFALWPDTALRQEFTGLATLAADAADGTPLPAENLHLTLAFLGQVSAASVADIVDATRSARFLPFELTLDRLGFWPRSGVAWLAPQPPQAMLEALVDDLWRKLEGLGFCRENRPYRPHVTLCRKVSRGLEKSLQPPIVWSVREFYLVESQPGAQASDYTLLQKFSAGD